MSPLTCEEDIEYILSQLPSENHCIDYKFIPYKKESLPDFINDVIAFLNSEESHGKDCYIILGVGESNGERIRKGIDTQRNPMPDDNELQNLIDMIRPRPAIHTGTKLFDEKLYGYIHILNSNTERPYEVAHTYPSKKSFEGRYYLPVNAVHEGQAFTRRGSKNYTMSQMDRRRVESQIMNTYPIVSPISRDRVESPKKSSLTIDQVAALVGVWDSKYDGDKEVIQQLSSLSFNDWECEFQTRVAGGSNQITYIQGQWTYINHIETIFSNTRAYFDSHLTTFFSCFSDVINSYDKKFDLPSDTRLISTYNEPTGKYSNGLREALVLSFVNIATRDSEFTSCTKPSIRNQVYNIITKLITEGTWQSLASLNWQIVNISQAYPEAFLKALQTELKKPNNIIEKLINEKEQGFIATRYYYGLVSTLQTLSWCADYFTTASEVIFCLTKYEKEIEKDFSVILLPWYPQTNAPIATRIGVIKHLVGQYGVECWDAVFELMPRQTSIGKEIDPPQFIQGSFVREKVSIDEFWSTSNQYLDELLIIASANKEYSVKLVDLMDDVNQEMFDKILSFLCSLSETLENDLERYTIWDKLLSFTERHRYFSESNWALPEDTLLKIDEVLDVIIPRNIDVVESRLFKKEQYDLLRSNKDHQEGEEELQIHQTETIKRILHEREIQGVFQFAEMVGSPQTVGFALAKLALDEINEEFVLEQLVSASQNLSILAKSYCNTKHRLTSGNWLSKLDIMAMSKNKRIMLLSSIYVCKDVLDLVITLSPTEQSEFWINTSQWADESGLTSQTVEGLVEASKLEQALEVLVRMIDEEKLDSPDLAYYVLEANLKASTERSQMWSYYINRVFEWLQKNMSPDNLQHLVRYEWCYYQVLSHEGQAKALEYTLSSSPRDFLHVLSLVYKCDKDINDDALITEAENTSDEVSPDDVKQVENNLIHNAWSVLYNWKWTPGKQLDGSFNSGAFTNWIDSVKSLSAQEGRYDIAMQNIGHVLYYAPESQDGFFIHRAVAATLDKQENEHIRRGYKVEAFNARGVYNYDPSGQQEDELARLWIKRAESAESLGYTLFGKALRDIAHDFLNQKEHY